GVRAEAHGRRAIEFGIYGVESRVSQVLLADAGEQHHAVDVQRVERVLELVERAVHVRKGQAGERAEATGRIADKRGGMFVAAACEVPGRSPITEVDAGCGDGRDRGPDSAAVHQGQSGLSAPLRKRDSAAIGESELLRGFYIEFREDMMMNVDAVWLCAHDYLREVVRRAPHVLHGACHGPRYRLR